jgi:rsbT co-antagonist protein RsbR
MSATKRPESRLTLEDMEEFFELTLEMICIAGHDGYFRRMNPIWTRVLGYSIEELMAEPFLSFVHPDDQAATLAVVERASREGIELFSFKNRYRCRDGSYRVLEWTAASSLKRGVLCSVARDVTERDREQQRLAHLVNASRAMLYSLSVSPHGAVAGCTFMSENVKTQLGYEVGEMVGDGQEWFSWVHPDDLARVLAEVLVFMKEGHKEIKYRFRHKDGSYRWLADERKLIRDNQGKPLEILGAWRDITEAVRAEELIRSQATALNELSTPLIPITDQIVVMPLIGTMDSTRAKQILDTLLEGVSARQARVAILDITGVSVVDAQVAGSLLQAARAVRLLGAEVVLTGIRPDVARTLVGLGLELDNIVTKGTLQAGIVYAMSADEPVAGEAPRGEDRLRKRASIRPGML